MEPLHIFRRIFPFFQVKKSAYIKISEEIWLIWRKFLCMYRFLMSASRTRIRSWNFWFAGSGSGGKWTGSAILLFLQTNFPPNAWLNFYNLAVLSQFLKFFCRKTIKILITKIAVMSSLIWNVWFTYLRCVHNNIFIGEKRQAVFYH